MITAIKKEKVGTAERRSIAQLPEKKSKIALFWEKYPNGIGYIVDHRAVLK